MMDTDRLFCIQLHDMDSYGYDTGDAGYLRIYAFAMTSATTACGQSTVTRVAANLFVIFVMNRNRPYLCVFVLICAYLVRMAFSNVLLRIAFDFSSVPEF